MNPSGNKFGSKIKTLIGFLRRILGRGGGGEQFLEETGSSENLDLEKS